MFPIGTEEFLKLKSDQSQDLYWPSYIEGSKVLSCMVPIKIEFLNL